MWQSPEFKFLSSETSSEPIQFNALDLITSLQAGVYIVWYLMCYLRLTGDCDLKPPLPTQQQWTQSCYVSKRKYRGKLNFTFYMPCPWSSQQLLSSLLFLTLKLWKLCINTNLHLLPLLDASRTIFQWLTFCIPQKHSRFFKPFFTHSAIHLC